MEMEMEMEMSVSRTHNSIQSPLVQVVTPLSEAKREAQSGAV